MKSLIAAIVLILAINVQAAQVIKYVDTDVVGGDSDGTSWANAYSTLSAWEAGQRTDLVTDGDYHTVYLRGSTDDTTCFTITTANWTTGAANYIEIIGTDFPADGI